MFPPFLHECFGLVFLLYYFDMPLSLSSAGGEVTGGGKVTHTCEIYDPATEKWSVFPSLPQPRVNHACVVHANRVYVSGGSYLSTAHNTIWLV